MSDDQPALGARTLFDLRDRVAVVSGASGWLGSAMCMSLAQTGATVVAVARSAERLEAAFADLDPATRSQIVVRPGDVGTDAWPQLIRGVIDDFGRLDILVNNAHVGHGGSLRTATEEHFDEAWNLSVKAAWRGIEASRDGFAAALARGGSPRVINVGSMYGMVGPDLSIYATEGARTPPFYGAAKAALTQLTRYAAAELGPQGVTVNTIVPGPFPQRPESMDPSFIERLAANTLVGRIGDPADICTSLLYLASPHSGFVTGSTVVVDGGWTAR